jgi:hypothetical protein
MATTIPPPLPPGSPPPTPENQMNDTAHVNIATNNTTIATATISKSINNSPTISTTTNFDNSNSNTTATTNNTITIPWPTPLTEPVDDFEDTSSQKNDLTTLSDTQILNNVRKRGQLRLMCCTWNMHGEKAPSHANMQLLLNPGAHHLIMVTTQECERTADKSIWNPSKAAWEAALNVAFGDKYVLVRSHGLAAIHISLLCHRALIPLISHIDSAAVATGLGSREKDKKGKDGDIKIVGGGGLRLGNKGGVGISIIIGSSSILFVGAHLAAHKKKCDRRNQDFYDIDHGLLKKLIELPKYAAQENKNSNNLPNVEGKKLGISAIYDYVFWGGDFNYRINGTREAIDSLLEHSLHSVLIENDQLKIEMKRNAVFSNFNEGPLHFKPTYKYDPGTDIYDTSKKKRCPSWTDRILWKCNRNNVNGKSAVINTEYVAMNELKMSDHRPVRACFEISLNKTMIDDGSNNHRPTMGQQGHKQGEEKNENTSLQEEEEQPVGIAETLLGVAKSQVCLVQ